MEFYKIFCLGLFLSTLAFAENLPGNALQAQAFNEISALSNAIPADNNAFENNSGLLVTVNNVQDFSEFVRVQTIIQTLAAVKKVEVESINTSSIELRIQTDDIPTLQNQLAQLNNFTNMTASNQNIALAYREVA